MDEFLRNASVLGGLLGATALFGLGRARWWMGLPLASVAIGLGARFELLSTSLCPQVFPWQTTLELLAWWALGLAARRGGLWAPGRSLGVAAALGGALLGPWAACALLASLTTDRSQAARAALCAGAASALNPAAHPALVALDVSPLLLVPLSLLGVALSWPRGALDGTAGQGKPLGAAVLLLTALGCALSELDAPVLLLGAGALWALSRGGATPSLPDAPARLYAATIWLLCLAVVLGVARAAGSTHQLALAMEFAAGQAGVGAPTLALGAALVSALLGVPGAALMLSASLDTLVVPRSEALPLLLAGGVALGGLGPALLIGAWRAALSTWGLQLIALAAWSFWLVSVV